MPVHDWSQVEAGIFHDFHHACIEEIKRELNNLLPGEYYALAEQHAAGFATTLIATPPIAVTAATDTDFYKRKQTSVAVRHVSGDEIVAMVEVVSPGNKSSRHTMQSFVTKACELLSRGIHLLILDVHPPGPRDPEGVHGAIWENFSGQSYTAPTDKPLTLAGYEAELATRAYVKQIAVGDVLHDMPLFLQPGACVAVPLETIYQRAFDVLPRRRQSVLES